MISPSVMEDPGSGRKPAATAPARADPWEKHSSSHLTLSLTEKEQEISCWSPHPSLFHLLPPLSLVLLFQLFSLTDGRKIKLNSLPAGWFRWTERAGSYSLRASGLLPCLSIYSKLLSLKRILFYQKLDLCSLTIHSFAHPFLHSFTHSFIKRYQATTVL